MIRKVACGKHQGEMHFCAESVVENISKTYQGCTKDTWAKGNFFPNFPSCFALYKSVYRGSMYMLVRPKDSHLVMELLHRFK